jgi:hypothetical protein
MNNNNEENKVIFEESRYGKSSTPSFEPRKSGGWLQDKLIKLVKKLSGGAIRTEKQAAYVVLIIAIVIFLISIYYWTKVF